MLWVFINLFWFDLVAWFALIVLVCWLLILFCFDAMLLAISGGFVLLPIYICLLICFLGLGFAWLLWLPLVACCLGICVVCVWLIEFFCCFVCGGLDFGFDFDFVVGGVVFLFWLLCWLLFDCLLCGFDVVLTLFLCLYVLGVWFV